MGLQTQIESELVKNSAIVTYSEGQTMELSYDFSIPNVLEDDQYAYISLAESDFSHIADGAPVLPVKLVTNEFVFGTLILSIDYEISPVVTQDINNKISFGLISPRGTDFDEDIYDNPSLYPIDWITYHKGGGLIDNQLKTFLSIRIYPVRYSPMDDQIQYITSIKLNITYQEPVEQLCNGDPTYDLLIITPSKFTSTLQALVDHKNDFGVKTILVESSEIFNIPTLNGRDDAEKIKYYIKDVIEEWGIRYVLLVGGHVGQGYPWYLPVRYSHVIPPDEQEYAEEQFLCDYYFADVFDSIGGFSSWDSNGNDVFAEWDETNKDEMDMYADVYLGRLPCRSNFEASVMVNKIINYEKERCADESWFKNLVLVAGDSYPDFSGFFEGKLICEEIASKMPGFNAKELYPSEEQDIDRETVKEVFDPGSGFAHFGGHGNPMSWTTHYPPNGEGWAPGFDVFDIMYLQNGEKLPVMVIGGCRNSQYEVTILNLFRNFQDALSKATWVPRCWNWWMTVKLGGGAIATIGSTGLGTHGREDTDNNGIADYLQVLDGWLEIRFYEMYGVDGKDILGEMHSDAMNEYMHVFLGSNEKMDVKMVQQWVLFGDPSLKIGGYD